jgi:nitroreductase
VIVACGDPLGWKEGDLEDSLRMSAEHGFADAAGQERVRRAVTGFLGSPPGKAGGVEPSFDLWANRHTMIAFTTMMWAAETMGYDTAPMEGFMEDQVKALLKIPERVRVVALLAIGRLKGSDKPYAGRFPAARTVFAETWGESIEF